MTFLRTFVAAYVSSPAGSATRVELSQAEVERLAEMEHGRWNVERLLAGWRWGPERDHERKTNPNIAPWSKISEEVKRYDREAVSAIPTHLAEAGYEVVRESTSAV